MRSTSTDTNRWTFAILRLSQLSGKTNMSDKRPVVKKIAHPLTPEQAIFAALNTPPPKKNPARKKAAKKKA